MNARSSLSLTFALSLLALLIVTLAAPDASARKRKGPRGTFKNGSGTVSLAYVGEGNVRLSLKTTYCSLEAKPGGKLQAVTFVPNKGITVHDSKNKPLLVIFYRRSEIVVWAGLSRFHKRFCRGGKDATGIYRRSRKAR
jgi:hypothetical protein